MIEVLESKDNCLSISNGVFHFVYNGDIKFEWEVIMRQLHKEYYDFELCDTLWEAIKNVL